MANRQLQPVSYRPFRVDPNLSDGLLSVAREGGDLERKVAAGFARMAAQQAEEAAEIAQREGMKAGAAAGHAGRPSSVSVSGDGAGGYRVYTGSGIDQAKSLLRDEEGFRESPYWDVNAHRVGYGSDTVIGADGRPTRVTAGMKISREDAERDLDYRLSAREGAQVRRQLGAAFDQLPANAQAALYSVGYNYGSLPQSVVAAGRGGDLAAIADAVGALSANPKRRQREAAMIRGGGGQVSSDGGPVSPASVGPITVTPGQAGSFRTRDGSTVYDRAYNIAGTKTYLEELKFTMLQDQEAVYDAYRNDPVMLEKALGELEQAHMRDHVIPEISDEYSLDFRKMAFLKLNQAKDEARKRQVIQDKSDYLNRVTSFEERKAQALARVAEGDQGAGIVVASLQNDIDSHYNSAVARGILTEGEAARSKKQSRDAMIVGVYSGQTVGKTPDEIAAMRDELYDRWSKGEQPDIDADAMGKIETALRGAESRRRSEDTLASKALKERGDDIASRKARGIPVSDEELSRFMLDRATAPDGDKTVASTLMKLRVAEAIQNQPIDQVEKDVWKLLTADGLTPSPDDYDYAMKEIKSHRTDVLRDPLSVAERMGVVPQLGGLPDPSTASPDEMAAALNTRMLHADVAAEHFGVPPKYFRPEEEETIKRSIISTDVEKHASAMKQLDVVSAKMGLMEVERQFGKDAVDRLQDWQAKVRYSTPEEAKQWLRERNDPQWQERVRPLVSKGQTEARKLTFDDVVSKLDDSGLFSFDAAAPVDRETRAAMMNDFVQLSGERMAVTNDAGQAQDQAIERMKKVWGTTSAFGGRGGRLMLYPPEEHYPTVAGSTRWISEELAGIAKEKGFDVSTMGLVSDSKTKAAIERKEAPGYLMTRVDPVTGAEELIIDDKGRPLRHFFDPKAAREKAMGQAEEARRTRNDPWLVLGRGTAVGPFYGFGQDPADATDRQKRIGEIMDAREGDIQKRRDLVEPLRNPAGLVDAGNIDLLNRPVVQNEDGSISTVRSMSFEEDGVEVLIPTVSPDGKILSDEDAMALYARTGQHLGKFRNAKDADAYAERLHEAQEALYSGKGKK